MALRERSFDLLPALSVRRQALRMSLRTVTIAWMFGIVWMSIILGSQMTTFCRLLGFTDRDFGILSSIPFAATLAQLAAAMAIEKTGLRKYMFIYYAGFHRILWLVIGLVPVVMGSGPWAIITFMIIYAISNVLAHFSSPPWQTWMGDLIPRRLRGRYFATRSLWTVPIQIVVALLVGVLLDKIIVAPPSPALASPAYAAPATLAAAGMGDPTAMLGYAAAGAMSAALPGKIILTPAAQPVLMWTLCVLFGIGAIFGTIDILLFLRLRDIVPSRKTDKSAEEPNPSGSAWAEPLRALAEPMRDRSFRNFAMYGATIALSASCSDQYYWINAIEVAGFGRLGANFLFMVCGAVATMVSVRLWGRLIDSMGRRPALIIATIGIGFSPLGWFLTRPGHPVVNYALAAATCVFGGAMWAGFNLTQTTVIMGFSQTRGRARYVAAAAVVMAIGGFVGGLAGGQISQMTRGISFYVGPFLWTNYHLIFLLSALLRLAAIGWLINMPDPGARPVGVVVREFWFNAYGNVMSRLFWRIRTLGRHDNGDDAD